MKIHLLALCGFLIPTLFFAQQSCISVSYTGAATYYSSSGGSSSSCQFDTAEIGANYCAVNSAIYDTAAYCGTCLQVSGQAGSALVVVNDVCPSCAVGSLDMNPQAFQSVVGNLALGTGNISWYTVPCPFSAKPIWLTIASGANSWYLSFLIHHATNKLQSVEAYVNSTWMPLTRQNYNYWTGNSVGDSMVNVRVTDIYGQTQLINNINMNHVDSTYFASANFPACTTTGIMGTQGKQDAEIQYGANDIIIKGKNGLLFSGIKIYDVSGKLILSYTSKTDTNSYSLPSDNFEKELYIVQIESTNGIILRKKLLID